MSGQVRALRALAAVLTRENAALTAMDLPAATALLDEKNAAIVRLPTDGPTDPGMRAAAEEVAVLARENARLLKRAMAAQERVLGLIARAAASAEGGYGARGRPVRASGPMAYVSRV